MRCPVLTWHMMLPGSGSGSDVPSDQGERILAVVLDSSRDLFVWRYGGPERCADPDTYVHRAGRTGRAGMPYDLPTRITVAAISAYNYDCSCYICRRACEAMRGTPCVYGGWRCLVLTQHMAVPLYALPRRCPVLT
eukprot:3765073-Rhodomonas_salina.5